jgi:DNA-binding NarL/FixJ family response regulator
MLTDREVEVLCQVGQGRTNHEIGEALFVTASTAKTHVRRLLMKLGAHDRSELVGIARDTGLLEQRAPG